MTETNTYPANKYTLGEEIANSVTHGIGVLLAIASLVILVTLSAIRGDAWRVVSFSIYGSCLVLLYLISTLYHAIAAPKAKQVFRTLDHCSVFLLIAGCYMPVLLVTIRGPLGWTVFGAIWALAAFGIILKTTRFKKHEKLGIAIYILMGWFCVIALPEIISKMPVKGIELLVAGGLFYTLGIIFYALKKIPYNHMIWHLFVLAGSICHFFAFLWYILPLKS